MSEDLDPEALRSAQFQSISSGLNGALDSMTLSRVRRSQLLTALAVFVVVNVVDQLAKQWARVNLSPFNEQSYFGGWFRMHHSENPGAFLSLGATMSPDARLMVFTGLVCVFLIWATWMMVRKAGFANTAFIIGWSLLIAGGFGNVIDRAVKRTVTDFMVMGQGSLQTGVFNIADMAIMLGIFVVLIWGRENPPAAVPVGSVR